MIRAFLIDSDRSIEIGSILQYQLRTSEMHMNGAQINDLIINENPNIISSSDYLKHKCIVLIDSDLYIKKDDWIFTERGKLEKLKCSWDIECSMEAMKAKGRVRVIKSSHPNHELPIIEKPILEKLIKFYNTFKTLPIELEVVESNLGPDVFVRFEELIHRAAFVFSSNWEDIGVLMTFAKTEELRKGLGQIMSMKYHQDEFSVGLL